MTPEQFAQLQARQAELAEQRTTLVATVGDRILDPETNFDDFRGAYLLDDEGEPLLDDDGNMRSDSWVGYSDAEVTQAQGIDEEVTRNTTVIARYETAMRAQQEQNEAPNVPNLNLPSRTGNAHDFDAARGATGEQLRGMAQTAIESLPEHVQDDVSATIATIERNGSREAAAIHRYAIAHSSEEYRRAFAGVLNGRAAMGLLSDEQRQALDWAMEARATLSIDTGLAFPINVDPSFLRTGNIALSPMRSLATVRSGTSATHVVNTFGAASFAMADDGDEVAADGTPDQGSITMRAQLMQGVLTFTISSQEDDISGLEEELSVAAAEESARLEAVQTLTGDGTAPNTEGVLRGALVTRVAGATAAEFNEVDVVNLVNQIPTRYRPRMAFMGALETHNAARFFESGSGERVGTAATIVADGSPQLMGRRWAENSEMDGPGAVTDFTTGDDILVGGDFMSGFRIYDRVGMSVELIPHMLGANQRPNGTRGLYVRLRRASAITNPDALRVLRVS